MTSFAIARYLSNGNLDETFGDGGKVIIAIDDNRAFVTSSLAVSVGEDDRIIVCGNLGGPGIGIAHIRPDGGLDDRLGSEATFTNSFMAGQTSPIIRKVLIAQRRQVFADVNVAQPVQPSIAPSSVAPSVGSGTATFLAPRVVVIGDVGDFSTQRFVAASRYAIDGELDQSFSNDGRTLVGFDSNLIEVKAAAFNPRQDRTVVIADGDDQNLPILRAVRLRTDGSLDSTFGIRGRVRFEFITEDNDVWTITPQDAVIQAGATIIAGSGFLPSANVFSQLVVVRLRENGERDSGFGDQGVGLARLRNSSANSVRIDARTRIIAAGVAGIHFALARFLPSGKLDQDLNQQGTVITPFGAGNSEAFVAKIDSPLQERIVAAGSAGNQFALARYLENGSLDPTFGTDGKVRTVILNENRSSRVLDIAFDSQQRIIAAGSVATSPPID